jgi:hypothetical protein
MVVEFRRDDDAWRANLLAGSSWCEWLVQLLLVGKEAPAAENSRCGDTRTAWLLHRTARGLFADN